MGENDPWILNEFFSGNSREFTFVIGVEEKSYLSHIEFDLIDYSSSPDEEKIDYIEFAGLTGAGGYIKSLSISQELIVDNEIEKIDIPISENFYYLNPGDFLNVILNIRFTKPGKYKFRVNIYGQEISGRKVIFKSGKMEWNFIQVSGFSDFEIKYMYENEPISIRYIGECY